MAHPPRFLDVIEIRDHQDLPAGTFGAWIDELGRALGAGRGMTVPCGSCNACCRSGYFIEVGAAETEALARIPPAFLAPAPGRPGDRVMGFDQRGRCPMLDDKACSIYPNRPLACRGYDCRVFAAAGLDPGDDGKADIAARARRWRFDYAGAEDRRRHAATSTAARLLQQYRPRLGSAAPANRTAQAVQAVACHSRVLELDNGYRDTGRAPSDDDIVNALAADATSGTPAAGPGG